MKRDLMTLPLDLGNELIIDNFAGGGGTSTGLEWAFGRPVDIAINHDPEALAMHALNHPYTKHLCESVWDIDPIKVTSNQPVGLVWLSPDCKHFSKAKGGTPVAKHIRGLAWVGLRWIALTKPRVMMLENVEEFTTWGPLTVGLDGNLYPDPKRKGKTFESFVRQLRQHGYQVAWKELRACDNGAPTIRKRLFLVARRDGLPIIFPEQTHGDPISREVLAGTLAPYQTAAECIDFRVAGKSIFGRKKDLALNTQRRVAKGLWRHVLTSPKPFIVTHAAGCADRLNPIFQTPLASSQRPHDFQCTNCGNTFPSWQPTDDGIDGACPACGEETGIYPMGGTVAAPFITGAGGPAYSGKPVAINQPIGSLTTENHRAVVMPTLAPFLTEHANASNQRTMPADEPLRTVCAQVKGGHFSIVAPMLAPLRGTSNGHMGGHHVEQPLSTVSAGGTHHALVGVELMAAHIQRDMGQSIGHAIDTPLGTVTAGGGGKSSLVAAHITKFRTGSSGSAMDQPMPTVTANSFIKRPGGSAPLGVVAAHLMHLTHHGDRAGTTPDEPLPTVTGAHRGEQALAAAFFEQANGGFYEGDGRAADAPLSTITASASNQRLATAYLVKYYSSGGQWQGVGEPMHTLPTKGRMGLVQVLQVPSDCLLPEHRENARRCAALLHEHLPEHFPEPADMVLMEYDGIWWVLVDITLRMLKARELYRAQSFPDNFIIHEIPDPKLLFKDGVQVPGDPRLLPRIPLTITAQIRMCGNSVAPRQAAAIAKSNFEHEREIVRAA